ncbi:MAG: hypothetical protein P8Z68_11755 [Kineosporiaceae bacterium]
MDIVVGMAELLAERLAAYPHAASCPRCQEYAARYADDREPAQVLWAVLAHHDSAHQHDPFLAAENFAALR